MAKAPKNAPATAPAIDLAAIVNATNAGSFVYVNEAAAAALVGAGMIELNNGLKNEAGEIAARATSAGIASIMDANTNTGNGAGASAAATTFQIEVSPALPKSKRGGGRTDTYPFDQLPAPDAAGNTGKFFVPATADKPKPWESLSSTTSAASKRYSNVTGTETYNGKDGEVKEREVRNYSRKFRIFEGEKNGVKGAYIERTL